MNMRNEARREMSLSAAILIFMIIGAAVAVQKAIFKADMGSMFFMCWLILIPIGYVYGYKDDELEKVAFDFTKKALPAVFILLAAGALISTWIAAGTTPTIIYYGINMISPKFFLVTALLLCSIVALFCGTSWGTLGTAGVAMMGVGGGLGIPPAITAGACICGAYFGDKMSPMSDTTILASAISEVNIFKHIKHMTYDQIPTYTITILFFLALGFKYNGAINSTATLELLEGLEGNFNLGLVTLLPLVVTGTLLARRKTALISILSGAMTAIAVAVIYQGMPMADAFNTFYKGFHIETESVAMAKLLNRGGLSSMWSLVGITLFGFTVAGMLEHMNIIGVMANAATKKIKSPVGLTATTILFGYAGNAIAMSQNFALVMTGTLMAPMYKKYNLQPKNCSRDLEVGGTYGALFIPWNSNAIFSAGVLGVSVTEYIPYIPLLYLTPIAVIIYSATRYKLVKIYDDTAYVDVSERLSADEEKMLELSS